MILFNSRLSSGRIGYEEYYLLVPSLEGSEPQTVYGNNMSGCREVMAHAVNEMTAPCIISGIGDAYGVATRKKSIMSKCAPIIAEVVGRLMPEVETVKVHKTCSLSFGDYLFGEPTSIVLCQNSLSNTSAGGTPGSIHSRSSVLAYPRNLAMQSTLQVALVSWLLYPFRMYDAIGDIQATCTDLDEPMATTLGTLFYNAGYADYQANWFSFAHEVLTGKLNLNNCQSGGYVNGFISYMRNYKVTDVRNYLSIKEVE